MLTPVCRGNKAHHRAIDVPLISSHFTWRIEPVLSIGGALPFSPV
jgi:hypothetical protein